MSVSTTSRRALPALGLLALAVPAFALAAPADPSIASLNTYEQLSRADGARGATQLKTLSTPVPAFASDLGIVGAYSVGPSLLQLDPPPPSTVVRSTLTNRSTDLGASVGRLLSVDRTETTGLFQRVTEDPDTGARTTAYLVGRLDGSGTYRDIGVASSYAQVVMSGNGRFVITSDALGLRRLSLATGQWTTISPFGLIEERSVSDDGQSIAGIDYNPETQQISAVIWKGGSKTVLVADYPYAGEGTGPQLSADGSTVFTVQPGGEYPEPTRLTARKVDTGRTIETALPFDKVYAARSIWVSPSGDRIAFALGYQDRSQPVEQPVEPAKVFDLRSGKWATFGGPFATSITHAEDSSVQPTVVSRSGRYAALPYNDQVALVSLEQRPLLGNAFGLEALSASSYLDSPGLDYCGFGSSSTFFGIFARPAAWVKSPRRAHITVSNGATVLADANWTTPASQPNAANENPDFVNVRFPLNETHTRNVTYAVVDGDGRRLTEHYSETLSCGANAG